MENSLLVFGAIAVTAILIIVNEYLLKSPITTKSKISSNKKVQLPLGAIEYLDTTYVPVTDFLEIKNRSSKRVEKNESLRMQSNRLKGTLFFIIILSVLFYLAA